MRTFTLAALFGAAFAGPAQAQLTPTHVGPCPEEHHNGRYCEERTYALPATAELRIDAGAMGGISVIGTDDKTIEIKALVEADSRAAAGDVRLALRDGWLRAASTTDQAPSPRYAVSYEVRVPHALALELQAQNGGIVLRHLDGRVQFATANGGVVLEGAGGDVKGQTTNGGVTVRLTDGQWNGKGLDITTTNGGIVWDVPAAYAGSISTATVHGNVRNDFGTEFSNSVSVVNQEPGKGTSLAFKLKKGGAPLRVVTTNGGIVIQKRG